MRYAVQITEDAQQDLLDIYAYVAQHDGMRAAEYVLDKLEETCLQLESLPGRRHIPPELERLQISDYREVHWKPYRIIYQIPGRSVYVLAVLDGRRELQDLLTRRLLRF